MKAAEAEAEAKYLQGQGIARQRQVCGPRVLWPVRAKCEASRRSGNPTRPHAV